MDALGKQFANGGLLNGRYEALSPLNHGSFGTVFMARDRVSGNLVALKCTTKPSAAKSDDSGLNIDDRSEELTIHSRIATHPNIVNLLDAFETDTHTYLVLEYCSMGDLYEAIRMGKGPKETEHVRSFMLQLVAAVEFMHGKGLYHRDIKPENIFLTGNGTLKLGDFGLATSDVWSYETAVGSDRYMAPEQYDSAGNGLAPARADIWSIGICLLNILFCRNPFGVPAPSDLLFSDFVRDRQSLFDVFSNMSQDTFEVLIHCLAIDPAKRSLALVRDALKRVVSFTTDDESLDDFCTERRDVLTATSNREPLRTPSITSPTISHGDPFPWAKVLRMGSGTLQQQRRLSVIHDEESVSEDLFPASEASQDWFSKADAQSINSIMDSGLGMSWGTNQSPIARSKPVTIAGSLPILSGRAGKALSSIFGKKQQSTESKSWSDLVDEEEEERVEMAKVVARARSMKFPTLSQVDSEESGRSTPRPCLVELKNPNGPNESQESLKYNDNGVSEHTGFVFEEHHPSSSKYSPPKRSLIDKWAALGERRRALAIAEKKETIASDLAKRNKARTTAWRRNMASISFLRQGQDSPQALDHGIWQQKEWNKSKDWRRSDQHLSQSTPLGKNQLDGSGFGVIDDAGFEWDEGWDEDLHL